MPQTITLGISSCLLGNNVRYDGGHQRDPYLIHTLGQYVEYVPVCPEVECGMPIPRESLRLVGNPENPRLITRKSGEDHTQKMQEWAAGRLDRLEEKDLCGFIFKSKSPSSGMERVKVYSETGNAATKNGVGIFAKAFMQRFPLIPVEEDGRLHDPVLRENFIIRIFALTRWRRARQNMKQGDLVAFHTDNKLLILGHSPEHYREMGKLVAKGKELERESLFREYEKLLLTALSRKSTRKKNTNVLQHMLGYFKRLLPDAERHELLDIITRYHDGQLPLVVPITLFSHHVRKYDVAYLARQSYLNPHPAELALRNHV
ncbi:uncharacterized protein YbgA (DUF1722 family) [Desulfobotulus alkaliphilus]|uniref:Uncharacterized protein YbgA (DUF1722 family) n=1 Tax=Desulfobotulus alkaliphilus TaxID=622671 RepID=A0A562RS73_9BACT|nr:DUF523 and DUF1722 domain-containing protein [Desulfobotulus alkaliphilus]TWI71210.1 uncharacterized protein YbgA (DUF1722 family) [Desulfobotulus alkaliphilus]